MPISSCSTSSSMHNNRSTSLLDNEVRHADVNRRYASRAWRNPYLAAPWERHRGALKTVYSDGALSAPRRR